MKKFWLAALLIGFAWSNAEGFQDIKMPFGLDKLAARATESVDVTLDSSMLQMASKFLSNDDPDNVKVKKLVSKLRGVYVRSFEFAKEGEYSVSDVEALRTQLRAPAWTRIVQVRSKSDNSDIFVKKDGDNVAGLVVIAAEPKELTVVLIDGAINLEELSELGGHMGIPKIEGAKKGHEKDKEEE